jgi:transcriptional regulator with XRE-family HTH domain
MKTKIQPYPVPQDNSLEVYRMPKKRPAHIPVDGEPFGKRLARLRKAAGYSQYTLADAVEITNRMVAYYEGETTHPPTHLLPKLAGVLGVTTDQLFGLEKVKEVKPKDNRLWQRFSRIEKLPSPVRRQVTQYLDTVLKAWKDEGSKD